MLDALTPILEIQELDIKMIRLVKLKKQRQRELSQIESLKKELHDQLIIKENEIADLLIQSNQLEGKIQTLHTKIKKLEGQQSSVKKVDEFNALTQEMTAAERERISLEHQVSNLVDKRVSEEEMLERIRESLTASDANSLRLEEEIRTDIAKINAEGSILKTERQQIVKEVADPAIFKVYERLLRNKKDRVVVPIENRTCSGCHISLTAQHENLVRKGKALVFCEHCSRIHFWQESEALEGSSVATKRRRRRTVSA